MSKVGRGSGRPVRFKALPPPRQGPKATHTTVKLPLVDGQVDLAGLMEKRIARWLENEEAIDVLELMATKGVRRTVTEDGSEEIFETISVTEQIAAGRELRAAAVEMVKLGLDAKGRPPPAEDNALDALIARNESGGE